MSTEKSSWDQLYSGNTAARGLGARLTAEAKRPSPERSPEMPQSAVETLGTMAVSETTHIDTTSVQEQKTVVHTGFATEPGYDDGSFNQWGGRRVDDNPRYF